MSIFNGVRGALALGAVTVLAACTASSTGGHPAGSSAQGSSSCPAVTSSYEDQQGLMQSLTDAIQGRDAAAFDKLAAAPTARQAMHMWWRNAAALGFTTGSVSPSDNVSIHGVHPLKLEIGVHSPLDPVDDGTPKAPKVVGAWYRLTTVHGGPDCKQVQIASWKPLSNTPWDSPRPLYVVKTAHTVVAADGAARSAVRRVARLGEKAARWDFDLFRVLHKTRYLEQRGFVTFVAANNLQANTWFRPASAPKPKGWRADAGNAAGFEFPMPGVQGWPSITSRQKVSASPTAGSRVVITPKGQRAGNTELEGTLVHEYVHAILRVNDLWSWGSGHPVPAATSEGAARWIEAMYYSNPRTPMHSLRSLLMLKPVLQSRPFDGRIPTDGQIYGAIGDANYYYDVAATAFSYLAAAYGAGFTLQSIVDAYVNMGGPFGGVVASVKGGTITFMAPAVVQRRWASWVRSGFALPAPS
jgi:hypothetical protein